MNEDYLQHHGVKGMRWGVIRTTRERHGLKQQMRAANKEARKRLDEKRWNQLMRDSDIAGNASKRYKVKKASLKANKASGKISRKDYRSQKRKAKESYRKTLRRVGHREAEIGGPNDKDLQKYKAEKKQNKLNYIRKAYNPKQVTFGRKVFDNMVQGSLLASYKYSTAAYPEASRKKRLGYSFVSGSLAGDAIKRK